MATASEYISVRPIRGQPFRLYMAFHTSSGGHSTTADTASIQEIHVSKDGAAFVSSINSMIFISSPDEATSGGHIFLDLTASEMDADTVVVSGRVNTGNTELPTRIIQTVPSELTTVPDKNSSLVDKITFIFQYFRNRRTVTATDSKLYKEDETTELGSATLDDDGSTFDKGEFS